MHAFCITLDIRFLHLDIHSCFGYPFLVLDIRSVINSTDLWRYQLASPLSSHLRSANRSLLRKKGVMKRFLQSNVTVSHPRRWYRQDPGTRNPGYKKYSLPLAARAKEPGFSQPPEELQFISTHWRFVAIRGVCDVFIVFGGVLVAF